MGELLLPVGIMIFTVVIAMGCVAAARGVMDKREKILDGWMRKPRAH